MDSFVDIRKPPAHSLPDDRGGRWSRRRSPTNAIETSSESGARPGIGVQEKPAVITRAGQVVDFFAIYVVDSFRAGPFDAQSMRLADCADLEGGIDSAGLISNPRFDDTLAG